MEYVNVFDIVLGVVFGFLGLFLLYYCHKKVVNSRRDDYLVTCAKCGLPVVIGGLLVLTSLILLSSGQLGMPKGLIGIIDPEEFMFFKDDTIRITWWALTIIGVVSFLTGIILIFLASIWAKQGNNKDGIVAVVMGIGLVSFPICLVCIWVYLMTIAWS